MLNHAGGKAATARRMSGLLVAVALAMPLVAISSPIVNAEEASSQKTDASSQTDASANTDCAEICGKQVEVILQQQTTESSSSTTNEGTMSGTIVEPSYTTHDALEYMKTCVELICP